MEFYDLAIAIWQFSEAKKGSMGEIVQGTGMSRRRAYYLRDAGNLIIAAELSREEAYTIGWTKLQIVCRHIIAKGRVIEAEDLSKYLDIARTTKTRDLAEALATGGSVDAHTQVCFHLHEDEQSALRKALLRFGAKEGQAGLIGREQALMEIIRLSLKTPK